MEEPNTALVIIGLSGNISWQTLWGNDYHIRSFNIPDVKSTDVVLMPVTVGTRFRITDVEHNSKKRELSFKFKQAPSLRINRKGVYYYGVIESQPINSTNVRSRIVTRVDQTMIARAKEKYPDVFKENQNIIFRSDDALFF